MLSDQAPRYALVRGLAERLYHLAESGLVGVDDFSSVLPRGDSPIVHKRKEHHRYVAGTRYRDV